MTLGQMQILFDVTGMGQHYFEFMFLIEFMCFSVLFIKDHFTARNNSQVFFCRSLALAYIEVFYLLPLESKTSRD